MTASKLAARTRIQEHNATARRVEFNVLAGKTLIAATQLREDSFVFLTTDGEVFLQEHQQDCCETVEIESIVGAPLHMAEEVVSSNETPSGCVIHTDYTPESYTWTFYKLATRKGYVDIRWFGNSNGYYSETVSMYEYYLSHEEFLHVAALLAMAGADVDTKTHID